MKQRISLKQLAEQLGVSASYLSQVRHGTRPASAKLLSNPDVIKLLKIKQNVRHEVDNAHSTSYNINFRAEVAQAVEQRTENPRVPSSILGLGTKVRAEVAQR